MIGQHPQQPGQPQPGRQLPGQPRPVPQQSPGQHQPGRQLPGQPQQGARPLTQQGRPLVRQNPQQPGARGQMPQQRPMQQGTTGRWMQYAKPFKVTAKFRFKDNPKFVSFDYSDELKVVSEKDGWLSGESFASRQPGLFPTAYTTRNDPVPDADGDIDRLYFNEVNDTLYQWGLLLRDFVAKHKVAQFYDLVQRSRRLIDFRNSLWPQAAVSAGGEAEASKPTEALSGDERKLVLAQMMKEIDSAVTDFGLDIQIRHENHEIATLLNTGPFSLFNMHIEQAGLSSNEEGDENAAAQSNPAGAAGAATAAAASGKNSARPSASGGPAIAGSRIHQLINSEKGLRGSFRIKQKAARPAISLVQPRKNAEPTAVASSGDKGHGMFYQIWVKLVMVLLDIGCDYELRLSLYSRSQNRPVTEEWVWMFSRDMTPKNREGDITSIRILFKNVENTEFRGANDMYLVTRVVRVGTFQEESSLSKSSKLKAGAEPQRFRRPFGAGATCLNVEEISDEDVETKIDLFLCSEAQFGCLPDLLINESTDPDIKPQSKSKGIIMTTRLFQAEYEDLASSNPLIRESDTVDMLKVATLVMPGTQRNDAYITLEEGDLTEKNVQVTCRVRKNTEQNTEQTEGGLNYIVSSEDGKTLVDSFYPTVVTSSSPKWRETFKVRPPADEPSSLLDCHLYFELKHISNDGKPGKTFAFSFLRLSDKGEIMKEGVHSIPLYKFHQKGSIPYLDDQSKKELKSACLKVSARISSTEITQNETLNRLFKWKSQPSAITEILHLVTFVNSNDIVKHLENVFGSLFDMLEQNEDKPTVLKQIYDNITLILEMLTESHSAWNFRPALDQYISKCYKSTCHRPLMTCLQKALESSIANKSYKEITTTTKVLDYVWMFIIKSHLNYTTQNHLKIDADAGFQQSLYDFLRSYRELLSIPVGSLPPNSRGHAVRALIYAMKHFPTVLQRMTLFFKPKDLCDNINGILQIVSGLAVEAPPSANPEGGDKPPTQKEATALTNENTKINEARLTLYSSIVSSELFRNAEMRSMLLPSMSRFMWFQLNRSLEGLKALGPAEPEFPDFNMSSSNTQNPRTDKIRECLKCIEIIGFIVDTLQIHAGLQEREHCVIGVLYLLPLVVSLGDIVKKDEKGLNSFQGRGSAISSEFAVFIENLLERDNAALKDDFYVMTVVLALLRVMTPGDWENFINSALPDDRSRVEFCTKLCVYLSRCFSSSHTFPKSWGMMIGFVYSTILKFVRTLEASRWFRAKAKNFNLMEVPPEPKQGEETQITNARIIFNEEKRMFETYYNTCLGFLECNALSKDRLSLLFLERYGDLRDPMCYVLKRTWKFFPAKFYLFPEVIKSFIRLADMQHDVIKGQALECYYNTLLFEFELKKNVDVVSRMTMEMFDTEQFSEGFSSFFIPELQKRINSDEKLKKVDTFKEVFANMQTFLLLVSKLEMIPTNEDNVDSRVSQIHDMLDFFRSRNLTDLFVKYLTILCNLFTRYNKNECLGHALLLLADLYKWDDDSVLPCLVDEQKLIVKPDTKPDLPDSKFDSKPDYRVWPREAISSQRACTRREELFITAAKKLEEGEAFEYAYAILQEAKKFSAEQEFNLDQVCTVLNLQARVAKSIAEKEGIPPEYYRVGFFGSDVDETIKNKEFIYLAHPLEKLVDFQERLEKQYPGCEFLKKTEDPGPDVTDSPGLKILVTPVKACTLEEADPSNAKKPVCVDPEHPTQLPEGVEVPKPSTVVFLYSKPFRKEERQKGENEFIGLYLRKLFFYVQNPFPSSRCRSVVSKRCVVEVSPLQNAINSVTDKTAELKMLIAKYSEHPETNPQPFIMLLNGVICAAVNGGTWMYKEAFLSDEYRDAHPDDVSKCDDLLASIVEQIKTLSSGMNTLDELCHMEQNLSMLGLFEAMQSQLQQTREMWNVTD